MESHLCWQHYFRFVCVDSFASAMVGSSQQCPAGSRQSRRRLGAGAGHVQSKFLDSIYLQPFNALMPSCLQIINAWNGYQLKGQCQVLPLRPLQTLPIRRIQLQVAPVPANLPQRYHRWLYPRYPCSPRVVGEKADPIAVRGRSSMTVIVLPQT